MNPPECPEVVSVHKNNIYLIQNQRIKIFSDFLHFFFPATAFQQWKVVRNKTVNNCISKHLCSPQAVFLSSMLNICGIRGLRQPDDSAFPLVSRLDSTLKLFPPYFYKSIKYLMRVKTMKKNNQKKKKPTVLPVLVCSHY